MAGKGQVTIFIIIGVVILIVAGILIYINMVPGEAEPEVTGFDTSSIKSFVDSCLESTLEDAIVYVSLQGGYNDAPDDSYIIQGYEVAYHHTIDQGDISPSIDTIEYEISKFIESNLNKCLDDFSVFTENGYSIDTGNMEAGTEIDDDVRVIMSYPLDIKLGDSVGSQDTFSAVNSLPLGRLYKVSQEYLAEQQKKPNSVRMTSLLDVCAYHNITSETYYDKDTVMYALLDSNNNISENIPYAFVFAVKYDWDDLRQQG